MAETLCGTAICEDRSNCAALYGITPTSCLVESICKDTGRKKDFWEEARSYGLNVGWAQSSRDFIGTRGMLTLARSNDQLSEKSKSTIYEYVLVDSNSAFQHC